MAAAGASTPLPTSSSILSKCGAVSTAAPACPSKGIGVVCVSGTPAPRRFDAFPVTDNAPRVMPWNPWVKLSTFARPVTLRASLSAASTELAPPGPGKTTR